MQRLLTFVAASAVTALLGSAAHAANARVNFLVDAVSGSPVTGDTVSAIGNTANRNWSMTANGTDFFVPLTRGGFDVWYTHNSAGTSRTRGVKFEMNFTEPIHQLGFDLIDFGTLTLNYARMGGHANGGSQTYSLVAYRNNVQLDLSLASVVGHGSLITAQDLGLSLGGEALTFDSNGTNHIGGGERDVAFRFIEPVDRFVLTLSDVVTTGVIGDTVAIRDVTWPINQVPEPASAAALLAAGTLLSRRRR